jgi:hypothetical protein
MRRLNDGKIHSGYHRPLRDHMEFLTTILWRYECFRNATQEVYRDKKNQNKVINRKWKREENDENQYEAFVEEPEGIEEIRRYVWGSEKKDQEESGKTYAWRLYGQDDPNE